MKNHMIEHDFRRPSRKERCKAKGVPKSIVQNEFTHECYRKVLHEKRLDDIIKFNTIRSKKYEILHNGNYKVNGY